MTTLEEPSRKTLAHGHYFPDDSSFEPTCKIVRREAREQKLPLDGSFSTSIASDAFSSLVGGPLRDVIKDKMLDLVARKFGWPQHAKPDFFIFAFLVYKSSPPSTRSLLSISRDNVVSMLHSMGTCSIRTAIQKGIFSISEAYKVRGSLFTDFHRFVFNYLLVSSRSFRQVSFARTIPTALAKPGLIAVLGLLSPFVMSFLAFLEDQHVAAINSDHWMSFLYFSQLISFPSLRGYDVNDSWPVILDEYAEWGVRVGVLGNSNEVQAKIQVEAEDT